MPDTLGPSAPAVAMIDHDHIMAPTTTIQYGMVQRVFNWIIRLIGWKVVGTWPPVRKFVFMVAPHTSNWDMPIGLIAGFSSGILIHWPYGFMMKENMFRGPLGPIMRKLGGLSINRSSNHDVVQQMADIFAERDDLILAVTPEGTRSHREYWKSGFYYIAIAAKVPIVPVAFDYGRREVGLGEPITLTGDRDKDIEVFRAFFQDVTPKRPENFGPVRFRPEP